MCRCFYFLIVVLCFISSWSKAKTTQDSTFYFETLTQQIGVRVPKLRQREYQIRFWVNTSLMFGEAQELYVITHKKNQLHLQKFEIWNNKSGYLKHIVTFKAVVNDNSFLQELLHNNLLSIREQHIIIDSLRKEYRNKRAQRDNTTRVEMNGDTVRVIAKKYGKGEIFMTDGISYYFEVLGKNFFRKYSCHCPKGYAEFYKETKELEQPLNIIQLIFNEFRESNKRICHVPIQSYNPFTCI